MESLDPLTVRKAGCRGERMEKEGAKKGTKAQISVFKCSFGKIRENFYPVGRMSGRQKSPALFQKPLWRALLSQVLISWR